MRKTILLIAALISLAANAQTHHVDVDKANFVASIFWHRHNGTPTQGAAWNRKPIAIEGLEQLHIFDFDGQGFVIVPADDRVMPVLAYSFENPFPTELNPELGYWLRGYNDQIAAIAKGDAPRHAQWDPQLFAAVEADSTVDLTTVPAMLTTRWNQSSPYNQYCPYDSFYHDRTVVGCVATAMAQIMKYWNYPSFGQGSHSYQVQTWHSSYGFGTLSADFGHTTYLWQYMPDELDFVSLAHERDAVATLSYHCGVAVEMMYGPSAAGGSGAYTDCGGPITACATNAFHRYFKYDSTLFYSDRDVYSDDEWCALIDSCLALGQPMYYHGSDSTGGHAFVLDGSDNQNRYHFNWGWGGFGDGFYAIDDLAPRSGGDGGNTTYTFNQGQGAIFGIKPAYEETFDTVDYYASACTEMNTVDFYEYHLRVANMDTLLRHLDTIFRYHLTVIPQKRIFLNPNMKDKDPDVFNFCPSAGFTFPECSFTNPGNVFYGWCHSKTGDDTIFMPGETTHINANRTYFALWIDTTTSGIEQLVREGLNLWPNPTTGEIYLSIPLHTGSIIVTDVLGRVVLREDYPNIMGGNAKISLAGLPNGIYNVQVKTAIGIYKQRIIKR